MTGLKNLFKNYIDIPEEKVDLVDDLLKVEELREKLDESINDNVKSKNNL